MEGLLIIPQIYCDHVSMNLVVTAEQKITKGINNRFGIILDQIEMLRVIVVGDCHQG